MTTPIDDTHDPARRSWLEAANGHADFPIQNLPFGVFSPPGDRARGGVAIGDHILDLSRAAASNLLGDDRTTAAMAAGDALNPFLALRPEARRALRARLSDLLAARSRHRAEVETWLYPAADCVMSLPARIGDYTDFYAGIHHAVGIGRLFRPDQPLLPNYKHVPIAYHGRASSVRPSGADIRRPSGQSKAPDANAPSFGPSRRLDIELELGVWIGRGNPLGEPIPIAEAGDHIAGLCLLNDWSARDFQAWEYQPLGPFLAKNFQTTVSPWIVTAEALAPFGVAQPPRPVGDPQPMSHLWSDHDQARGAYAINLEVLIRTPAMRRDHQPPVQLSGCAAGNLYWTVAQMVSHHASGGCDLNPGDLIGTGTISGANPADAGSLMELTQNGQRPVVLPNGEQRTFLEDGDEMTLVGHAVAEGYVSIGFGPCSGCILPARA